MSAIIVKDRQNIIDLAVMYYGSSQAVMILCQDNGLELDDDVSAGTSLTIRDTYPDTADSDYASYIQTAGIVIATNITPSAQTALGTTDNGFIVTNDNNYIEA